MCFISERSAGGTDGQPGRGGQPGREAGLRPLSARRRGAAFRLSLATCEVIEALSLIQVRRSCVRPTPPCNLISNRLTRTIISITILLSSSLLRMFHRLVTSQIHRQFVQKMTKVLKNLESSKTSKI